MKSKIKRPTHIYWHHALWIALSLFYAIKSSTEIWRLILIVIACLGIVSLISLVMKRDYFEIKDKELLVNKNFFRTRSVKLREISRVEIEPILFIPSKIYLKNGGHIKYMNSAAHEEEVKELLEQFNIPVE